MLEDDRGVVGQLGGVLGGLVELGTVTPQPNADDWIRQDQVTITFTGSYADGDADPITYRSVQLKGAWLSTSGATEEDHAWVKRHRELFASNVVLVGEGPEAIRNTYMSDIIRIDMRVDAAFDQTPGPEAGKPL